MGVKIICVVYTGVFIHHMEYSFNNFSRTLLFVEYTTIFINLENHLIDWCFHLEYYVRVVIFLSLFPDRFSPIHILPSAYLWFERFGADGITDLDN